jgi:hypothetical protein
MIRFDAYQAMAVRADGREGKKLVFPADNEKAQGAEMPMDALSGIAADRSCVNHPFSPEARAAMVG